MVVFSFLSMITQRLIATLFTSDHAANTHFIRKTKFYYRKEFGKPKRIAENICVLRPLIT